jgi:hypothetical protein
MIKCLGKLFVGFFVASTAHAIEMDQVQIFGYGSVLYRNYDYLENYQQDPKNRAIMDFERFVLSPRFLIDDNTRIVSEIEFEHGGTGSATEYDTLDEFGEFETEIGKGGEVVIEEGYLEITFKEWLNWRIGHMIIPVGLNTQRHLPTLYLSSSRNISETTIIPDTWHETGILIFGKFFDNLNYQASVTNGLNSEFFNSAHWIRDGHQKRFEVVNANDLAGALRIDYGNIVGSHIGVSVYSGKTGQNRNKSKLSVGEVTIVDLHWVYDEHNIKLRGLFLAGKLTDSEEITVLNKGLPNALEAKKSPVASEARAYFVELGYDIAPLFSYSKGIVPFVKYDFVDSMHNTDGDIPNLDRYERIIKTAGINYFYRPAIVYKADYSLTSSADANIKDMDTYTLSAGYQF